MWFVLAGKVRAERAFGNMAHCCVVQCSSGSALALSMGVYLKKGVLRLIINQRAAKVEGLDLAPAIRLIATTIK